MWRAALDKAVVILWLCNQFDFANDATAWQMFAGRGNGINGGSEASKDAELRAVSRLGQGALPPPTN